MEYNFTTVSIALSSAVSEKTILLQAHCFRERKTGVTYTERQWEIHIYNYRERKRGIWYIVTAATIHSVWSGRESFTVSSHPLNNPKSSHPDHILTSKHLKLLPLAWSAPFSFIFAVKPLIYLIFMCFLLSILVKLLCNCLFLGVGYYNEQIWLLSLLVW